MAEEFDKDFGYLIPFLDKVAAAAGSLSDASSRDELTKLMADEKARWIRIRSLLSGAGGQSASSESKASAAGPTKEATPEPEPLQFTVGSLRQR